MREGRERERFECYLPWRAGRHGGERAPHLVSKRGCGYSVVLPSTGKPDNTGRKAKRPEVAM